MMNRKAHVLAALAFALAATPAAAQQGSLGAQCSPSAASARAFCENVAEAIQIVQPGVGIALSGGNPVPGTASTLGMRLGTLPRISLGVRASAALVEIGGIESAGDTDDNTIAIPTINLDASIGLFSGLTVAPTVGGLGSIDLLASVGRVPLPEGEGFDGGVTSWSAGLRVGILRESFTAPGVSLSGMYRATGDMQYGETTLSERDAYFALDDLSSWSLRAAASKRLFGFGLTAGAGYDRYHGTAVARIANSGSVLELRTDELETSRTTVFGNASFTLLVLHLVGEVGWQRGGEADPALTSDRLEKAGIYGGLALRISL